MTIRNVAALLRLRDPDEDWLAVLAADRRAGVRQLVAQWRRARERERRERERTTALFALERRRRAEGYALVAGVDEAGVGPLAGPVVAAAVLLPDALAEHLPRLRDSKALLVEDRERIYAALMTRGARVGIGLADVAEIDRVNILQATKRAWRRAVAQLLPRPDFVLIDGRYRIDSEIPQQAIVDGDALCASIAAASIVAKVTRDRIMTELDRRFPEFGFAAHKGYATMGHYAAIRRFGFSPVHRRSFLPLRLFQQDLFAAQA